MCGIFAYIGTKKVSSLLVEGLKRLEYRGYDSAGISVKNGTLQTIKSEGSISKLRSKVESKMLEGSIGIAHTRWATHGKPNTTNAHPHVSCDGRIAIVHNGIIENYQELKSLLQKEKHSFRTETDTEVIVHLIEKHYSGDIESAVKKSLSFLKGTYGLVVVCEQEDKLVAAKNGSPLILGVGEDEFFIASDASAIIPYTKSIIQLEDSDVISLTRDNYRIEALNGEKVSRLIETTSWDVEQLEKKGYDHFMLKEIHEQPDTIRNTLRGRITKDGLNAHLGGLNMTDEEIRNVKRIIFLACGTSWHACLVGEYLFEHYHGIPVEVEYASEFRYRKPVIKSGDLVIAISQSGETADTLAALSEAKKLGAKTLGIVNVVGSAIARKTDGGIYLYAGPEIGVASTKAFTSQIVALHLLNLYFGRKRNSITAENAKKIISSLQKLPDKIKESLELENEISALADGLCNSANFLYLGRGINFPVALEGALKLKEISYIHAEGYPAAEMKHGPIALIDQNMPVVFIANKNNITYEKIISNMEEVKARKGRIIAIASKNDKQINKLSDKIIRVPDINESLSPIINTIPLQLLAYHIAVRKGLNVDKPRNLAKSVTVE